MSPRLLVIVLLGATVLGVQANSLTEITSLGTASQTHSHSSGLLSASERDRWRPRQPLSATRNRSHRVALGNCTFPASERSARSRSSAATAVRPAQWRDPAAIRDEAEIIFEIAIVDGGRSPRLPRPSPWKRSQGTSVSASTPAQRELSTSRKCGCFHLQAIHRSSTNSARQG